MRKLKDRLKETAKKLRQDKPPAPGCQADGHVNDGAGHSAVAVEANGSEGCNHALSSVPDEMQAEQDLWQRAFDMLSEHEKKSLSVLAKKGRPTTKPADDTASVVSSLVAATRQKQEQCEKRFWRINIPGKPGDEIILREQAAQVISWLTKAGDIGMKFAPSLAQQVWPCVKAVLQIPVSEIDQSKFSKTICFLHRASVAVEILVQCVSQKVQSYAFPRHVYEQTAVIKNNFLLLIIIS